jgi:hypothetical protein
MDRITRGYIDRFAASQELQSISDESRIFELFACYCVLSREYPYSFDLFDIATGGGCDGGIDGMAIIANNVLINSSEEFDDLVEQTHHISDIKFVFVQAKTSSSFSGSDIATFGFGVQDLFKDHPEMVRSEEIKEKSLVIDHILNNMIFAQNKPKCLLYYVTTGRWVDDQNVNSRIEGVKNDLIAENLFSEVVFVPVDADYLQRLFKSTIDKIQVEIDFPDRIALPEMSKIEEAYLGVLPANQFLNLVSNEDGIIKSILYDNVRDFQGENAVNHDIEQTLLSPDADKFVVLNNGITIICKELRNVIRNRFLLRDYQIVNGCQTSHVLYANRSSLAEKVYVSVKIISTSDEDTVNQIVKATNRQTEVTDDQLLALNDFNKNLETYYQTYSGPQRLYYERRSKQYATTSEIEKVRIITVPTQIKTFASMFLDKPHLASRYYGRLLKDSSDIFSETHCLIAYYISAYALYKVEYLIRNKQIDQSYNRYRFHILMLIKYLVLDGTTQPHLGAHKMEQLCQNIQKILDDSDALLEMVHTACQIINAQIDDLANSENAKTLAVTEKLKTAVRASPK